VKNVLAATVWLTTNSEGETRELGMLLGRGLSQGDFIALVGELGTGKTCLVKGIAAGMGVAEGSYVHSPTFTLLHIHRGRLPLFHLDCYRIEDPREIEDLGYRDIFYGGGVTVVEWAEKIRPYWPPEYVEIAMYHRGEARRDICVSAAGDRYRAMVETLGARIEQRCGRHGGTEAPCRVAWPTSGFGVNENT